MDVAFFAPSVVMQGGPSPEELMERLPQVRRADPDALTAVVAAVAGFSPGRAYGRRLGLPSLRAFQAAQCEAGRACLARRTAFV